MALDQEALIILTEFPILSGFKDNPSALAIFGQILEKRPRFIDPAAHMYYPRSLCGENVNYASL